MLNRVWRILLIAVPALSCAPEPADDSGTPSESAQLRFSEDRDEYLARHVASARFGGTILCASDLIDSEANTDSVRLYVWALCQEYRVSADSVEQAGGFSMPATLLAQRRDDEYRIVAGRTPRDGEYHDRDMAALFPERVRRSRYLNDAGYQQRRLADLQARIDRRVRAHGLGRGADIP